MKKRLLVLLLAISLLLSLCPAALAAEGEVRVTDFFTEQPHADVDFADMAYTHMDTEPLLEEVEKVRALLKSPSNAKPVEARLEKLTDQYQELLTMQTLATIRTYQDVTDEAAAAELRYTTEACTLAADGLLGLVRDVLDSPCGDFLRGALSGAEIAYFSAYEALTDQQISLSSQETLLESEYLVAAHRTYTAQYGGKTWDEKSARDALASGSIDSEAYGDISLAIVRAQNEALGDLYLRMTGLRREIALSCGYDSYGDYAYAAIYQRDYTQQEIRAFHQAVREYVAPVYEALLTLYSAGADSGVYARDYAGDTALEMMEPYLGRMSSELVESFSYMRRHGLYDTQVSAVKAGGGFTTVLSSYGAPFFFNSPGGTLYDFTTAVHEFGHYNHYYWQPGGWSTGSKSVDLAEVHSQGFELLFSHYYPDLFGEEAQAVLDYQLLNLTGAMVQGSLQDELQQFVYAREDVTLEEINREYRRLCGAYGLVEEDAQAAELYGWVQIPHTFTNPFYYISYAVSAAGAFAFWMDAQEDYLPAVDRYLEFTALPAGLGFQTSFQLLGMGDPLSGESVEALAGALWEALELAPRLEELTRAPAFTDVYEDSWFASYVLELARAGLVQGFGDGSFRPNEAATRDMASLALTGAPAGEGGSEALTRLAFARMLAEYLELPAKDAASPFPDTADPAAAALAELGILTGYDDGTFRPDSTLSRAELCAALCRAALAEIAVE